MIKCHLGRLMGERKLKVIDVARATELHRNTVDLLYKGSAKQVEIETLNRLCAFFECSLSDLLEYIPESKKRSGKDSR